MGSSSETSSAFSTETITGSHLFKISGYSLTKGIGIGESIESVVFTVGGYNWFIKFYPDGYSGYDDNFISIFIELKVDHDVFLKKKNVYDYYEEEEDTDRVRARTTFTILQHNGAPSNVSFTTPINTFKHNLQRKFEYDRICGAQQFAERAEFEASELLKNDTFTVKCTVTIVKGTKLEEITNSYGIIVPPSNLNQNLANLLESGNGADVTFVVKGGRFEAHRCVLAARSAVFSAELFGCMKEKWIDTITIEDIDASVFKSMLYFIYADSLPDFEGTSDDNGEKQDLRLMAQHLLVAADRYQLERLRLMCEDLLCKNLAVSNVWTTLFLADQHNCTQLKAECFKFLRSPEVFKAAAQTDGFHNLIKICPTLKDI